MNFDDTASFGQAYIWGRWEDVMDYGCCKSSVTPHVERWSLFSLPLTPSWFCDCFPWCDMIKVTLSVLSLTSKRTGKLLLLSSCNPHFWDPRTRQWAQLAMWDYIKRGQLLAVSFPFLSFPFLSPFHSSVCLSVFLGQQPQHMEVPRPGVKSEL